MCDRVPSLFNLNVDCLQLICDYLTIEEFINFSVACSWVANLVNSGVIKSRKVLYICDDGRESKTLIAVRKYSLYGCAKSVYFYTDGRRSYRGFFNRFLSRCTNLSHLTVAFTSFVNIDMPRFNSLVSLELKSVYIEDRHTPALIALKHSLQHLVLMFVGGDLTTNFLPELVHLRSLCLWMNVSDGGQIARSLGKMEELRAVDIRHYSPEVQSQELYLSNQSVVLRAIASLAKLEEYVCYFVEEKMEQYLHILRTTAMKRFSLVMESCARKGLQLIPHLCKMECVRIVGWYSGTVFCKTIDTCLSDVQCLWLQNYNNYSCGCCCQYTTSLHNLTKLHTLYYVHSAIDDYGKLLRIIAGLSSNVTTMYIFSEFINEPCKIFSLVCALRTLNIQRNTLLKLYLVNTFGGYVREDSFLIKLLINYIFFQEIIDGHSTETKNVNLAANFELSSGSNGALMSLEIRDTCTNPFILNSCMDVYYT